MKRLLPLFQRRTPAVAALLPELFLHGLALGDVELALRGWVGDAAPLSASSLMRFKATWQAQYAARPDSILAAADQVGRRLAPSKARFLRHILQRYDLVFIGYSGLDDFDLFPLLLTTRTHTGGKRNH